MDRAKLYCLVLLVLVMTLAPSASQAAVIRHDQTQQSHLNLGALYPSVGLVTTAEWSGSGTLIGSNWVLTAAHVVEDAANLQFTIEGQTYGAVRGITHNKWDGSLGKGYDIGLIELSLDVATASGVSPAALYTGGDELGQVGTFVGYGMTGTGLTGATGYDGLRRGVENMLDVEYLTPGKGNRILGADFDNPANSGDSSWGSGIPLALEGLIAPGDSGGGLFIEIGGIDYLAGVHSFGSAVDGVIDFDYGDRSGHTRVSSFTSWIDKYLGGGDDDDVKGGKGNGNGNSGGRGKPSFIEWDTINVDTAATGVPEPATLTMLMLGGLAMLRRKK